MSDTSSDRPPTRQRSERPPPAATPAATPPRPPKATAADDPLHAPGSPQSPSSPVATKSRDGALERGLVIVARGEASLKVTTVPDKGPAEQWITAGRRIPARARRTLQTTNGAETVTRLDCFERAVNASAGTMPSAVINAAVEAARVTDDYAVLVDVCEAYIARQVAVKEAHVALALTPPPAYSLTPAQCVASALNVDAYYAHGWFAAAEVARKTGRPFVYGSKKHSRVDCLMQAVQCPDAAPMHWASLGAALDATTELTLPDGIVTRKAACDRALELDAAYGDAYFNLALSLGDSETYRLRDGRSVAVVDCMQLALEHGCTAPQDAWFALMHLLRSGGVVDATVTVRGETYDCAACCMRVVGAGGAPSRVEQAWEILHDQLANASVRGRSAGAAAGGVSRLRCAVEIVHRKPKSSDAWLALARAALDDEEESGTKAVGNKHIELKDGTSTSPRDALCTALQLEPRNASAWAALGTVVGLDERVTVGERDVTGGECCLEAVDIDSDSIAAWLGVKRLFENDPVVLLKTGGFLTKKQWCVNVLNLDPAHCDTLVLLGKVLGDGGDAALLSSGKQLSARDCLVECLAVDPSRADAWTALAQSLLPDETASIGGKHYDKKMCLARATELGDRRAQNWVDLGHHLKKRNTTAVVKGVNITADQCFERALAIDPDRTDVPLRRSGSSRTFM